MQRVDLSRGKCATPFLPRISRWSGLGTNRPFADYVDRMEECVFRLFTQLLPGIYVVPFYFFEARHVDFSLDNVQANSLLIAVMIRLGFLPMWNEEGMSSVIYRPDSVPEQFGMDQGVPHAPRL